MPKMFHCRRSNASSSGRYFHASGVGIREHSIGRMARFGSLARPLTLLPDGFMLIANRPLPGLDPEPTLRTYAIQSASMQNA
jgi:hypothetical protein